MRFAFMIIAALASGAAALFGLRILLYIVLFAANALTYDRIVFEQDKSAPDGFIILFAWLLIYIVSLLYYGLIFKDARCQECGTAVEGNLKACGSCGAKITTWKISLGSALLSAVIFLVPALFIMIPMLNRPFCHSLDCPCIAIKGDLGNMAIAEELYFTNHNVYTTANSEPELPGFKPSYGRGGRVKIAVIHMDDSSFTMIGSHPKCDDDDDGLPDMIVWDSANGGYDLFNNDIGFGFRKMRNPRKNMELGILLAAAIGDQEMLGKYMAAYNSNVNAIQLKGVAPLALAERNGHKAMAERLKAVGADGRGGK